jgi:hypothetical protein
LRKTVIPAKAGIQRFETYCEADKLKALSRLRGNFVNQLDSGLRRNDGA